MRVGGPPTGTHRANCRATSCHVDTHIVAWPAVHGHRHRCDNVDNIFFEKNFISFPYVKSTNGGLNGITIRLHKLGHKRMDQGAAYVGCKFLLDSYVYRYPGCNKRKCRRNYFQDTISSNVKSWTLGHKKATERGEGESYWNDWLLNEHQTRTTVQVYSKMGKSWGEIPRGEIRKEYRFEIVFLQSRQPRAIPSRPGFFCTWIKG